MVLSSASRRDHVIRLYGGILIDQLRVPSESLHQPAYRSLRKSTCGRSKEPAHGPTSSGHHARRSELYLAEKPCMALCTPADKRPPRSPLNFMQPAAMRRHPRLNSGHLESSWCRTPLPAMAIKFALHRLRANEPVSGCGLTRLTP